MLRIGLTGGIGAGKSVAATRFAELGATVVDHDALAHRVVEPGSAALVELVHEFGDRVVFDGALDRAALADVVFNDMRARERLNAIVHPYVRAMARAEDKRARMAGATVVVHDIPLLVESGQGEDFEIVVTIAAEPEVRLKRLMEGRSMRHADASARMAAQVDDDARAHVADVVLDGNGDVDHRRAQVDEFWRLHVPE